MSAQYDQYLRDHKRNVAKAFQWIRDNLSDFPIFEDGLTWDMTIDHDSSKSSIGEYNAYDAYFYGGNKSFAVVNAFRAAWLHHIHNNPHHWQHWILINDDPNEGVVVLEMPKLYVIEMICDWWSFSWQQDDLRIIFKWWADHRAHIQLHPKTLELVVSILAAIDEKLKEQGK